ncbi:sensor histidine kinase [Marinobacter piscensis]|uniref:sensor histidine kinase n=1 Tax=Marinobacter piscensis TaxID=1562308 RepID=UPI0011A375C2|nr:sensor histidine kinase [Marinobacter piscensis]
MSQLSLSTRLAIIIFLGSFIAVGSIIYTAYDALLEDFLANLSAQQAQETAHISSLVSQDLQHRTNTLAQFADLLKSEDKLLPPGQLTKLLKKQEALAELFPHSLSVLSPDATLIAENIYVPGRVGTHYGNRPHWKEAIKTQRPVISRPIIGMPSQVPLLIFIVPITDTAGELLGFLSGTLKMNQSFLIPEHFRNDASSDAIFLVVDTDNFLFVEGSGHDGMIASLPDPGENLLIDAALSGVRFGEVSTASGKTLIYATNHLQRLGWLFIRAVPKSLATAPAKQAFTRFFLITLGLTLTILLLTYLALRSTTASLTQITRRIDSMTRKPESSRRLKEEGAPEVRDLARAFNQLMNERDAYSQLKDNFISNVSHELRTPLTSVNGALRLLQAGAAGELPERARDITTLALRNGERLQRLIGDLLDFNKLASGRMRLSFHPVDLQGFLMEIVDSNQAMARESGITLAADNIPAASLNTDGHRLRQIIDNFVSNAIKFSPPEGQVTIHTEYANHDKVRIVVSDQGAGVPDTFKHEIFERFAQAETGTDRAHTGTGLGLAISRRLAELLESTVGYYNDAGAHFWVEVPVDTKKPAAVKRPPVFESAR